jgi:hypothetical protein
MRSNPEADVRLWHSAPVAATETLPFVRIGEGRELARRHPRLHGMLIQQQAETATY